MQQPRGIGIALKLVSILALVPLLATCRWFDSADGGFGFRTVTGVAGARAVGFNSGDDTDGFGFRSSDISFWALETTDDIVRAYSNPTTEIADPILALQYNMGDMTIRFENGQTLEETLGEVPDFDLSQRYNMIRIDIGMGFLDVWDDDAPVEHLYDASGNELIVVDNDMSGAGVNCNSILLVDDTWVSTPFYASREVFHTFNAADFATYGLPQEDAEIYQMIFARGDSNGGGLDIDGALVLPFSPQDFSSYESVESVIVEFVWDIAGAFEPYADGYRMVDRTGTGLCLDFAIRVAVNE